MDKLFEVMRTRRSIRAFAPEPVGPEAVDALLAAATAAPTAGNMQAWFFYVVQSRDRRRRLAEAALGQRFVAQAPVVIAVCADLDRARAAYGSRGVELYAIQDSAAATENILLRAHALGLGACWVGAFDEALVREILGAPDTRRPLALVPIGRPAEIGRPPGRRPLSEISEFLE